MSTLEFVKDGIPIQVLVPQELDFKKTLKGELKATCPKCEAGELELGERYLTEMSIMGNRLSGFELVKNGKRAAEILNKLPPPKELFKRWRERKKVQRLRRGTPPDNMLRGSDEENWSFQLTCPMCFMNFNLTTIAKNPIEYQETALIDDLKEAVRAGIERDGLTMKALARISVVRGTNPENYLQYVERTITDLAKIDAYIKKFSDLLNEGKKTFESGLMTTFTNLMETDLITVSEQLKKEFKEELDRIMLEMFDASFVEFPAPEESLPEKIIHKLKGNEATLAF